MQCLLYLNIMHDLISIMLSFVITGQIRLAHLHRSYSYFIGVNLQMDGKLNFIHATS